MHLIRFPSQTQESIAIRTLQQKVGDSVIIVREREYAVTEEQKNKLDQQHITYKYLKEVH